TKYVFRPTDSLTVAVRLGFYALPNRDRKGVGCWIWKPCLPRGCGRLWIIGVCLYFFDLICVPSGVRRHQQQKLVRIQDAQRSLHAVHTQVISRGLRVGNVPVAFFGECPRRIGGRGEFSRRCNLLWSGGLVAAV